jgi:hypothetical protein
MEKKFLVLGFFIFISAYPLLYIGLNIGFNWYLYWFSIILGFSGAILIIVGIILSILRLKISKGNSD